MAEESGDLIYHYCPAEAFLGIIENGEIWLTNMFYMSDAEEHYYFRRLVLDAIRQKRESEEQSGHTASYLKALENEISPRGVSGLYCACFSKDDGDSLNQSRAYADDGRGVAIGFRREFFLQNLQPGIELVEMIYDEGRQKKLASAFVEEPIEQLTQIPPDDPGNIRMEWAPRHARTPVGTPGEIAAAWSANAVVAKVWKQAAGCKHPTYRHENEVRLVFDKSQAKPENAAFVECRSSRGMLIPYLTFRLDRKEDTRPIQRIVFGPKTPAALNRSAFDFFLSRPDSHWLGDKIDLAESAGTER